MVLADGVKICRFCGAALDEAFWAAAPPAPRPSAESGSGMFSVGAKPDAGPTDPSSRLTPLPWTTPGSNVTPLPSGESRRPQSRVSPLPGVPEPGGRLAPLSFEAANELALRGSSGSSPAIAPPQPPPPKPPVLQANLRTVGLVALALLVVIVTLMLRSAGDTKPEAGSQTATCAEGCEKEAKLAPEAQLDPQGFISGCMARCLRPPPEKKVR